MSKLIAICSVRNEERQRVELAKKKKFCPLIN